MTSTTRELTDRLRDDPLDAAAYERLKAYRVASGELRAAADLIEEWGSRRSDPIEASQAYLEAAQLLIEAPEDTSRAIALLERALTLHPPHVVAAELLHRHFSIRADVDGWIESLERRRDELARAGGAGAELAKLELEIGDAWEKRGQPDRAGRHYRAAYEHDAAFTNQARRWVVDAHLARGEAAAAARALLPAIEAEDEGACRAVIELADSHAEVERVVQTLALETLARLYGASGRHAASAAAMERLLDALDDTERAASIAAELARVALDELRDVPRAERALERWSALSPGDPEPRRLLVELHAPPREPAPEGEPLWVDEAEDLTTVEEVDDEVEEVGSAEEIVEEVVEEVEELGSAAGLVEEAGGSGAAGAEPFEVDDSVVEEIDGAATEALDDDIVEVVDEAIVEEVDETEAGTHGRSAS